MRALTRWLLLVMAVGLSAFAIAACGGDDEETTTATAASGGDTAAQTEKIAEGRTIGVIPSSSSSEFLRRQLDRLKKLTEAVGIEVKIIDPNGDPAKMDQAAQTLVTQKVDAIFTFALGGEEVSSGLAKAKAAGIPTIAVAQAPTPGQEKNYGTVFGDSNVAMGEVAGRWIAENQRDTPVVGLRLTQNFAGDGFIQGVEKVFKGENLKFQDLRDTNQADIINSMTSLTDAIVQKNEGPLTFVDFSDFGPPLMTTVFERQKRDDITVITRYDNASTIKLMKAGKKVAFVSDKNYQHAFDAVGALLALWKKDTPLPKPQIREPEVKLFTAKDLPADAENGVYPFDADLQKQVAEWQATYGGA